MVKRRSISTRDRLEIFTRAKGICHICGGKIDGIKERWDVEHVTPLAMGGEDGGDNLQPAHAACHADKTKADVSNVAKAKRREARHMGIKTRHGGFPPAQRRGRASAPISKPAAWRGGFEP